MRNYFLNNLSLSLSLSLSPRAFEWARGMLDCLLNRFQSHKKAKSTEVTGLELRPIAFSFCAQYYSRIPPKQGTVDYTRYFRLYLIT